MNGCYKKGMGKQKDFLKIKNITEIKNSQGWKVKLKKISEKVGL